MKIEVGINSSLVYRCPLQDGIDIFLYYNLNFNTWYLPMCQIQSQAVTSVCGFDSHKWQNDENLSQYMTPAVGRDVKNPQLWTMSTHVHHIPDWSQQQTWERLTEIHWEGFTDLSSGNWCLEIYSLKRRQGPRWQSGNTLASHLWGRGSIPVTASSGKAGSCLPLVGSLQYRSLTNCMYWFPLPFQVPVVIWPVQRWKRR